MLFTGRNKLNHKYVLQKEARRIFRGYKGKYTPKNEKGNEYLLVYYKKHPNAGKNGYIPCHVIVAEYYLERFLNSGSRKYNEVIHHKNGCTLDNRWENLKVMLRGKHQTLHNDLESKKKGVKFYYRDVNWLYNRYAFELHTMSEIAKMCNCSINTISRQIIKLEKRGYCLFSQRKETKHIFSEKDIIKFRKRPWDINCKYDDILGNIVSKFAFHKKDRSKEHIDKQFLKARKRSFYL